MQPKTVIFGDVILDEYVQTERIKNNPESTGSVYRVVGREYRAGGAAAVAMLSQALGAGCQLIGPTGQDEAARTLGAILERSGVSVRLSPEGGRVTPVKTRYVCNGKLLPDRIDIEEFQAFSNFSHFPTCETLIISDYGKGACDKVQTLIKHSSCSRIIVDPSPVCCWIKYKGANLIKANFAECKKAAQRLGKVSNDPFEITAHLANALGCEIVLTKDADGMFLHSGQHIPAHPAIVVDVCGAGDTVTAAIALGLSKRQTLEYACRFAAEKAAAQIQSIGICPV